RANDSNPASSSAVKKTSGMTGLRIDQAEMLRKFMRSVPVRGYLARRNRFAFGQEPAGAQNDALGAREAAGDRNAPAGDETDANAAALRLVLVVDDVDIAALVVRQDRRFRQQRCDHGPAADRGAGEPARAELGCVWQRDARRALAAHLLDRRRELPDLAGKTLVGAHRRDARRDADRQLGEIGLADFRQHLHLAALGDGEQRLPAARDGLTRLDVALEHEA